MSNTTCQYSLINPNTSLAFLPSEEAAQLEGYRYITIVTLGVHTLLLILLQFTDNERE